MPTAPSKNAADDFASPSDLHVMTARLRTPEDRPLPAEDEIDSYNPVDGDYDAAIREHLEPHLGTALARLVDTECPFAIDVALVEPRDGRAGGAMFTVGAGAVESPVGDSPDDPPPIRRFELIARLPASSFQYWEGVVLEPFDDLRDAVSDALGELARLPHLAGVCYRLPQVVTTPDLSPLAAGLPFAGALLRDASEAAFGVPGGRSGPRPIAVTGVGVVTFMTVTFLHATEVRALLGDGRKDALARLGAARVDELVDVRRRPVV